MKANRVAGSLTNLKKMPPNPMPVSNRVNIAAAIEVKISSLLGLLLKNEKCVLNTNNIRISVNADSINQDVLN